MLSGTGSSARSSVRSSASSSCPSTCAQDLGSARALALRRSLTRALGHTAVMRGCTLAQPASMAWNWEALRPFVVSTPAGTHNLWHHVCHIAQLAPGGKHREGYMAKASPFLERWAKCLITSNTFCISNKHNTQKDLMASITPNAKWATYRGLLPHTGAICDKARGHRDSSHNDRAHSWRVDTRRLIRRPEA